MKPFATISLGVVGIISLNASTPVTFTKLTGLTGGANAGTAVYRADLSSVGFDLLSISISDNSSGLGGAAGQFSGFDLDAIKLSYTSVGTAADAQTLAGLGLFTFDSSGTLFTPGTQRAPTDPKLFGTDATGNDVDHAVATLGAFDGESTTSIPPATGFVSMGDNGVLAFNLNALTPTAGLFLYIGEVGDNGEVAAGAITVSDKPVQRTPDGGATAALLALGFAGLACARRR